MIRTKRAWLAGGLAVLALGATTFAIADQERTRDLVNEASIGVEEAINIATTEVSGTVVETELEREDGTLVWEVEVLSAENVVSELTIDARSGDILEQEVEDDD